MRYLYTTDDDHLFAYAPGRRDFFRAGDDRLWAHESHDWLIAAESGVALAHRTGDVYYDAVDGARLYRRVGRKGTRVGRGRFRFRRERAPTARGATGGAPAPMSGARTTISSTAFDARIGTEE